MPHTETTIFRDTTTNPVQGVEIADIQAVLVNARNDIGKLIETGDINKWAKYKPVRSAALRALDDQDYAAVYWGLSIEVYTDLGVTSTSGSFLNKLVNGQLGWEYLKPRGASYSPKEWFRMLDFDRYDHAAICPVGEPVTNIVIDMYGNATLMWDKPVVGNWNLQLSDIVVKHNGTDYPLTGFYLCLLLVRGNTQHILVSDTAIGANDVSITLVDATPYAGTWRAYPFFSDNQSPGSNTGIYLSAGWAEPYMDIYFRRSVDSLSIVAYGTWNDTYTAISLEWFATNEDSASKTVTPTVNIYKNTTGATPDGSSNPVNPTPFSLGQITVPGATIADGPGRTSGTATIQFTAGSDHADYYWFLGVFPGSPYTPQYAQIEEPDYFDPNATPNTT